MPPFQFPQPQQQAAPAAAPPQPALPELPHDVLVQAVKHKHPTITGVKFGGNDFTGKLNGQLLVIPRDAALAHAHRHQEAIFDAPESDGEPEAQPE